MNKSVVITGSTRGIGYRLAEAFQERGCAVTVSGRTQSAVAEALTKLGLKYGSELAFGLPCDVTDFAQVQNLWESAKRHFSRIDIWINNAGLAVPMTKFWELSADQYEAVVRTNLLGTMYGSKIALAGMLAQGFGALYNMEGFGARGGNMRGMTTYGSTKAAIHFMNRSLAGETSGTPIITGAIAPGMVITDLVTRQFDGRMKELEKAKPILNIIAERAETVAPVLVDRILKNHKNGASIRYTSPVKMMSKFLTAPFKKRDLFTS
ncbi:MAG TPA: SDR family oxidoreductase [Anaerolineales bacterium]